MGKINHEYYSNNQGDSYILLRELITCLLEDFKCDNYITNNDFYNNINCIKNSFSEYKIFCRIYQNLIMKFFYGSLKTIYTCNSCKRTHLYDSEVKRIFQLPILKKEISYRIIRTVPVENIYECLTEFTKPFLPEAPYKSHCPFCKKVSSWKEQVLFVETPQFLILQLKRFYGNQKIESFIDFNFKINLSHFVDKDKNTNNNYYKLIAIGCHDGTLRYGHYFGYAKRQGVWFKFNENKVQTVNENLIEKRYGSYFIYKKT